MAKYIKLESSAAFWPECCALCLRKNSLIKYEKDTVRTTKDNYVVVSKLTIRSYKNTYPVCKDHHGEIRGSETLLGVLKAALIGLLIVSIVPIGMYLELGKQGGYAVAAVLLSCAILYYRRLVINKIPIWVREISDDFVVLRFANNKYADEFLRKNREVSKALNCLDL